MGNHELKRSNVGSVIKRYADHIAHTTSWYHTSLGIVDSAIDVTRIDPEIDIPLEDIYLRQLEITIRIYEKEYVNDINQLLNNIETKKLALSHPVKLGLLRYVFIDPTITVVSKKNKLIKVSGKLPRDWKNITKHFQDYLFYKTDINKYFKVQTLKNIAKGISKGSIMKPNVLDILLGKSEMPKIFMDKELQSAYLNDLDKSKQIIFKTAASENDILLIKGPPGTGKSKIISELIKHFIIEKKEKVILSSRTHAALDNVISNLAITPSSNNYTGIILEKSSYGFKTKDYADKDSLLVRNIRAQILSNIPVDGRLAQLMKTTFGPKVKPNKFLYLKSGFVHPSLFVGTITSSKLEKRLERGYSFDDSILIMDEVSKSTIVDVLRYSMYSKKIILIGDDMQLGPIPFCKDQYIDFYAGLSIADKNIFDQLFFDSVFERLYKKDHNDLMLRTTYRSPDYILDLYNHMSYKGKLETKVSNIKKIKLKNSTKDSKLVTVYNHANLILLNHNGYHYNDPNLSSMSKVNFTEMDALLKQLDFLSNNLINYDDIDIMVLFVYKDQHKHFYMKYHSKIQYYKKRFNSFNFGTIDQLQGSEADIVFLNTTYAVEGHKLPNKAMYKTQLQEVKRLNVALSRTKSKFILLINTQAYRGASIFNGHDKLTTNFDDILNKFDVKVNV